MVWDIPGFDNTYLRPIFAAAIVYHAGAVTGQGTLNVLCVGMRTSGGNLVVDTEVRQVFSQDDCNTAAGAGSQLALMGKAALKANPNAIVSLAAVLEPGGGTQATVTVTIAGSWSTPGTMRLRVNGVVIDTTVGASDTPTAVATNIAAAVNANADSPFTAGSAAGVVTLTCKNKGVQGTQWIIYQDTTYVPAGLTSAIVGSTTVNTYGLQTGVAAGATATGTGSESVTNILAKINTVRYARIAFASNDVTNAALIKTFLAAQANVTVQLYDQAIYAVNGTLSNATTLAQTTLNDPREQVFAYRNSETHPAIIAAGWASFRAATESVNPVPGYDGQSAAAWVAPTQVPSDSWLPSEENALLNAGVTPMVTVNATAVCSRAITTYCLNGAAQDTRCLDIGDAVFPDYLVLDLQNLYSSVFKQNNLYNEDNPQVGQPDPLAGVATPNSWVGEVLRRMAFYRQNRWILDTFSPQAQAAAAAGTGVYLPVSAAFNNVSKRIQSDVPFIVNRVMHQLSVTARQTQNT